MKPEQNPEENKNVNPEKDPSFIEGELTDDELRQVTGGTKSARGRRWGPRNQPK